MQVTITFRGMESTESLKSYVKERIEHIEKYFDKSVEAHAVLSLERYLHHADITIQAGSYLLRGKVKSEDMYKSIDESVDKIEKQLKRYKDKLKTTKRVREDELSLKGRHQVFEAPADHEEGEAWSEGPKVIRSNEFFVKPMTVEEAIMQMDLLNNEFLVFTNAQSGDVNVVYRRKDGHFGLIEAHSGAQAGPGKKGKASDVRA
ncbi:MAG: ribosome-associated translation inhibitor RaiA [Deltaproteobacteria bacterium]|nr:ribosome-associated translation inhibitor RaiA [Deltaproteobacteria bacterium]